MTSGSEADALYLELIIEIAERVQESLRTTDANAFAGSRDLSDVTAYRLASIGEATRKLSGELKARHGGIAWPAMVKLRNIVAHHYESVELAIIWRVATHDLAPLLAACRLELAKIDE